MQHIVEENESIIKDMLGESPTLFDEVWTFPVNPIKDADIMSIDEQGTINTNTTYQAYPVDFYDQLLPTEDIKVSLQKYLVHVWPSINLILDKWWNDEIINYFAYVLQLNYHSNYYCNTYYYNTNKNIILNMSILGFHRVTTTKYLCLLIMEMCTGQWQ